MGHSILKQPKCAGKLIGGNERDEFEAFSEYLVDLLQFPLVLQLLTQRLRTRTALPRLTLQPSLYLFRALWGGVIRAGMLFLQVAQDANEDGLYLWVLVQEGVLVPRILDQTEEFDQ